MKTALLFPGQGVQYQGMMKDIVDQCQEAKQVFDIASEVCGRDIYSITMGASREELGATANTQPCLLAAELAAFRGLTVAGLEYQAVAGFSMGEWAALVAADVTDAADAIGFIEKRASAMQRAVPVGQGGMAVMLGKDRDFVQSLCDSIGGISPANYNCPGNITVAGLKSSVDTFLATAAEQGITAQRLDVSVPSHCGMMQPAADELRPLIDLMQFREPSCDLVMNATGLVVNDVTEIKNNLIKQLLKPVMFQQGLEELIREGFDTFVEVGPGKTLSGMVKRTAKQVGVKVKIMQMNSLQGLYTIKTELLGC